MKSQINIIRLVYPPISNQEAEWVKDDPEVQAIIRESNLYMICHREEAFFKVPEPERYSEMKSAKLPFEIECGDAVGSGVFDLSAILQKNDIDLERNDLEIEVGEKLYRFWRIDGATRERLEVVEWFTLDKLLLDRSHDHYAIAGIDNYAEFLVYHLHYVGISKQDDSLLRLVVKPHDKRLRILSNEQPMREGARVTDEVFLLFFTISPLRISVIESPEEIDDIVTDGEIEKLPIIADAEKAFVNILDAKYNAVKFKGYPKGTDGLYGTGLARYAYVIGEHLTLTTVEDSVRGGHITEWNWPDGIDCIFVEGENVTLMKHDETVA